MLSDPYWFAPCKGANDNRYLGHYLAAINAILGEYGAAGLDFLPIDPAALPDPDAPAPAEPSRSDPA